MKFYWGAIIASWKLLPIPRCERCVIPSTTAIFEGFYGNHNTDTNIIREVERGEKESFHKNKRSSIKEEEIDSQVLNIFMPIINTNLIWKQRGRSFFIERKELYEERKLLILASSIWCHSWMHPPKFSVFNARVWNSLECGTLWRARRLFLICISFFTVQCETFQHRERSRHGLQVAMPASRAKSIAVDIARRFILVSHA